MNGTKIRLTSAFDEAQLRKKLSLVSIRPIQSLETKLEKTKTGAERFPIEELENALKGIDAEFDKDYFDDELGEDEIVYVSSVRLFYEDENKEEELLKKIWQRSCDANEFRDTDNDLEYWVKINVRDRTLTLELIPQDIESPEGLLNSQQIELFIEVLNRLKSINISLHDALTRYADRANLQYNHPPFFYPDPNQIIMPKIAPPIDADN